MLPRPTSAGHGDLPAQNFGQGPANGQPQAGAFKAAGGGAVRLPELVKDMGQRLRGDAHAGIPDDKAHPVSRRLHRKFDLPPVGELHRVGQEVDEDLLQLVFIGGYPGQVAVTGLEFQAPFSRQGPHRLQGPGAGFAGIDLR